MATHSSILAGRIPQREETSRLQSIGSQRVGHDWSDLAWTMWVYIFYFLDYLWDEFCFCFIIYLNFHYCGLSYLFVLLIFQLDFKFYYLFLWVFNIIQVWFIYQLYVLLILSSCDFFPPLFMVRFFLLKWFILV